MKSSLYALAAGASTAMANFRGFNYGSLTGNQGDFETAFKTAAGLPGTQNSFTSARLYTMVQDGTASTYTEAIQAAIDTKTTLLLGLWASQDQNGFNNEITALKSAIAAFGNQLADLVVGISVGSEDLYRETTTSIQQNGGIGQSPSVLVDYIGQVRNVIQNTPLSSKLVGHVDTWNAFVNGTNNPVIQAADFLGLDEYPYFQASDPNAVENGGNLFFQAYDKVKAVASGKQIWITEAGWPVSGKPSGAAIPSTANAEIFWQDVFCQLVARDINTWWYTLNDTASPSFSVSLNGTPLYNLACNASSTTSSSSSSSTSTSSPSSGSSTSGSTSSGSSSSSPSSGSSSAAGGSSSVSSSSSSASSSASSSDGSTSSSTTGTGTTSGSGSTSVSGSGTGSSSPSVTPNTNGAGKLESGVAVVLMACASLLL